MGMSAWIKLRTDLWDDPRVVRLSCALCAQRATVVGALVRLWSLGDTYTTDGLLAGYNATTLDIAVGIDGFAAAAEEIGWLAIGDQGLEIPRFSEHNGASAKRRAGHSKRVSEQRKVCAERAPAKRTRCAPEEEEEEDINTPLPPSGKKRTKSSPRTGFELPTEIDTPALREAVTGWLAAKRKPLTERGLKALATRVSKRVEAHGEEAVIDAFERAVAQGYAGWEYDEWFDGKSAAPAAPASRFVTPEEYERLQQSGELDAILHGTNGRAHR